MTEPKIRQRPGPKPKGTSSLRSGFPVTVDAETYARYLAASTARGISMSEYVRDRLSLSANTAETLFDAMSDALRMARETGQRAFVLYSVRDTTWRAEQGGIITDQPILWVDPEGRIYPDWDDTPGHDE